MRALVLIGALLWSGAAFASLPASDADGWFSWQIDNVEQTTVWVRLRDGQLRDVYMSDFGCRSIPKQEVTDLGLVSPDENFTWFRSIVDDEESSSKVKQRALFGVVQSGSDEAFSYLEGLIEL